MTPRSATAGLRPTRAIVDVLAAARSPGISTKSNLARTHADAIAEAASRCWITTQIGPTEFGRVWLLTTSGLAILNIEKGLA